MRKAGRHAAPVASRDLGFVLLVGAAAAPALLAGSRGTPDPLAALCWVSVIATAGGFVCGSRRISLWPLGLVVPVLWILVVAFADILAPRDLPAPAWAALPLTGLFALGYALGACVAGFAWRGAGILFLVATLLAALPLHGAIIGAYDAPVAARLLDFSPATLIAECAGVDWMRHPPIYEGSSTVDIDPSLRSPYSAQLAGALVFVVGCALAAGTEFARRRRAATATA